MNGAKATKPPPSHDPPVKTIPIPEAYERLVKTGHTELPLTVGDVKAGHWISLRHTQTGPVIKITKTKPRKHRRS